MKANEFVKKYSLYHAKEAVRVAGPFNYLDCQSLEFFKHDAANHISISELKRFVESHELVNSLGGIEKAKDLLVEVANRNHKYAQNFEKPALEKAIRDVEACL